MDFAKEIAELREKILTRSEFDIDKNELYCREVRNELALKRDQVVQLRKELQTANSKIFELNKELEINRSLLKESEFNLKLSLKKAACLEEKLKEIDESHTNLKLREEMRLSEIQILNENIQKTVHENHHLSREVEELKDRLKYSRSFQNELEDRQTKINVTIAKIKENSEKLEKEQARIVEFDKKIQNVEEVKNLSQLLIQENIKLSKENKELENALTETTTKFEKLHNLIKGQKNKEAQQQSLVSKIRYLQWQHRYKRLEEKNLNNETIIARLSTTLHEEIATNAFLIEQNQEYEARIQRLENERKTTPVVKEEVDVIQVD